MHKLKITIDGDGFTLEFQTEQQVAEALQHFANLVTVHGSEKAIKGMCEAINLRNALVASPPQRHRPNGIQLG